MKNRVGSALLSASAAIVTTLCFATPAHAEVTLAKVDNWEFFTQGRINAFFSYGWGDANPLPNQVAIPGESIPLGGGLDTGNDSIPRTIKGPDGMDIQLQGTFKSMRVRSGFVPNVLGFGLRRKLNDQTTLKAYIAIWGTIESLSQRKASPVLADAREGYLKLDGPWGSLTAGRALDLFSRGATETDFMYGHGYGLGFAGNIDSTGPTNGLIGFGVLAAFFSPGIMYATPPLAGLQLSVGVYDPTTLPGAYEATRYARPETELTYDLKSGSVKVHLFGNGAYQKFYHAASNESTSGYGAGYGGRLEVGGFHIGASGHVGKGLGLQYAFEPGAVSVGPATAYELRKFDGYSVLAQYATGTFDFNAGWGMSRAFLLDSDKVNGTISVLKNQQAYSVGVVYHATEHFHLDVDAVHAKATWFLGETQDMNFVNTGVTATW